MDLDKLYEEKERLEEVLVGLDPTTETYAVVQKALDKNLDMIHKAEEAEQSRLDHLHKRDTDERRLEQSEIEEDHRVIQAKKDTAWGVVKHAASIAGTIGGIIILGILENSTIISQKGFSLVRVLMPKV